MPVEDRSPVVRQFAGALMAALINAGAPSFARIESMAKKVRHPRVEPLPHSTVQGHLSGDRRGLPRWEMVRSLVVVLRIFASMAGKDPDEVIGTVDEWEVRHKAAVAEFKNRPGSTWVEEAAPDIGQAAADAPVLMSVAVNGTTARRERGGDQDAEVHALLDDMARRLGTYGWWHGDRRLVPPWHAPYLSLEPAAERIHSYEHVFCPGLLQDEDYARAVICLEHGDAPAAEIDRRVALRMDRQRILHRPKPVNLWCVLDETALYRQQGGRQIQRAQIQHLIDLSQQSNITIQIMPMATGGEYAAIGAVSRLRFAADWAQDVFYLEDPFGAHYPDAHTAKLYYSLFLNKASIKAETPADSIRFLHRALRKI
ncbi:DUF5753 domain-containing protein [Actinomadura rubrisoli]|uniref:DUF5753 domain-containing protein n=1 Tax=Actinomadura rubrisoli TaxID=2530368 RepID=A0A4R4ZZU6_9ACTN|nr:DUF5753 domain-containing protein [Actinomadura rubrisoli]TDD64911.1 hypothetical protein E1298_41930 [Actinomadura rubrisoli]